MAAQYPAAVAAWTTPASGTANQDNPPHDALHRTQHDEIVAVQTELGINPSGSYADVAARLAALGTGGGGGVTDHGALTGLNDPQDHLWAARVINTDALAGRTFFVGNAAPTGSVPGDVWWNVTVALGMRTCTAPIFTTTAVNDGTTNGPYYIHNNVWNTGVSPPPGVQTLNVCAYNNWNVVSNQTDHAGAVISYPNVHLDFPNAFTTGVPYSNYTGITSTFACASPRVGIYDVAYDIWLNGVGWGNGHTEVMIWTENFGQTPLGSASANVNFGGQVYTPYHFTSASSGGVNVVSLVANPVAYSGTVNIKAIIDWAIGQGWIPAAPSINQLGYGVEIVSTNGTNQTFAFPDFSLTLT